MKMIAGAYSVSTLKQRTDILRAASLPDGDEVRRGNREEGCIGLARHGASQHRLSSAGRPVQQQAFGRLESKRRQKSARIFQESIKNFNSFLAVSAPITSSKQVDGRSTLSKSSPASAAAMAR